LRGSRTPSALQCGVGVCPSPLTRRDLQVVKRRLEPGVGPALADEAHQPLPGLDALDRCDRRAVHTEGQLAVAELNAQVIGLVVHEDRMAEREAADERLMRLAGPLAVANIIAAIPGDHRVDERLE